MDNGEAPAFYQLKPIILKNSKTSFESVHLIAKYYPMTLHLKFQIGEGKHSFFACCCGRFLLFNDRKQVAHLLAESCLSKRPSLMGRILFINSKLPYRADRQLSQKGPIL